MSKEQIPRAEIKQIAEHFKGKPRTDDSIREFCNLNKIGYVPTTGELEDIEYQIDHDEKMTGLYKSILLELQNLVYIPEFTSNSERKKLVEQNDNVRISITKLFENAGVTFRMVDKVAQELGGMTGKTIEMAGTTAFNKAMEVLNLLAKKEFGGEFNLTHARDYMQKLYDEHAKKKEEGTTTVIGGEIPQPENSSKPQEENSAGN